MTRRLMDRLRRRGKCGQAAAAASPKRHRGLFGRLGQVVVEMLLILPVFLTIIFTIMEMGHLAFWVIVLNHATYECARIGAMLATRNDGSGPRDVSADMQKIMSRIIQTARIDSKTHTEETVADNQADVMNHDLVVVGAYDVHLVFPISNILLSNPKGSGMRHIEAVVRMPVEQPLQRGESDKNVGGGGGNKFKGP